MNDLDRLRLEYAAREHRLATDDRYSASNVAYRFMKARLNKKMQDILEQHRQCALLSSWILEVGCGNGNVLEDIRIINSEVKNLVGIDLLWGRLLQAKAQYPLLQLANADGQCLPFPEGSFSLVMQFTALSSVLDDQIRIAICREMLRVVSKNGLILSYDFWLNPSNPQTRGLRPAEIRRLFPGCQFEFHRITLAPPISRRLASISWGACSFLEGLRVFNTHYLVAIRPGGY